MLLRRRAAGDVDGIWKEGLPSEIDFWRDYVRTRGQCCGAEEEFAYRFDPEAPLQDWASELLPARPGPVRILDVGAGPATWLGKKWVGREVEIVAIDPLADAYGQMLAEESIKAPVPTISCEAERAQERFGSFSFDLVFARNSIDHARDAFRALSQMFGLVRRGSSLLLVHALREGEHQLYTGLHQWNFVLRSGELFLNDRLREQRVLDLAGGGFRTGYCRMRQGLCWAAYQRAG